MVTPPGVPTPPFASQACEGSLVDVLAELPRIVRRLDEGGQPDSAVLVENWRSRSSEPVAVAVVGEVKRGKSTLVNALAGMKVSATGTDVTTRTLVTIKPPTVDLPHASALVLYSDRTEATVPVADALAAMSDDGDPSAISVQVALDLAWLSGGALVDTPGVGGLVGAHGARARAAAQGAGALLFVTDGGQVLTRPELDFLAEVSVGTAYVVLALTKTDRSPEWQTVLAENRRLLTQHAPRFADAPVYPVAPVFVEASWSQDSVTAQMLVTASRIESLGEALQGIVGDRRRVAVANALTLAVDGFDRVLDVIDLEERALVSSEASASLEEEESRLEALKERSADRGREVDRDLHRARADALALLSARADHAEASLVSRAHQAKGTDALARVIEDLGQELTDTVEEVRSLFAQGLRTTVDRAFAGLEPPASPSASDTATDGFGLEFRALDDLLPVREDGVSHSGRIRLGRVVSGHAVSSESLFDPAMASQAFMGARLGDVAVQLLSVVGLAVSGNLIPAVGGFGWVVLNAATRRGRENRAQLASTVASSVAILRRELPQALDTITRELRPELFREYERSLDRVSREVSRIVAQARAAAAAAEEQRRDQLSRLTAARRDARDERDHVVALLTSLNTAGTSVTVGSPQQHRAPSLPERAESP